MAAGSDLELALRIRALIEGQQGIVDLGESFIDINKRVETLIRGLTAISGSTEGAQRELEYLKDVANTSGLSVLDLADNFIKLSASAKGTALEGEATRTIFESVSNAMAVLGGDTTTTHRAFNALAQIMSKGQVYSEELKGQLAEAIPGALQIMSRALGISTKDMLALMEAGRLSSDALLPFAEQLNKEFGLFATSSTTFTQAVNRLSNTWTELMSRIGNTGIWSGITSAINELAERTEYVAGVLGLGLGVAIQKVTVSMVNGSKAIYDNIRTTQLYGSAAEQAAKSELDRAVAAERSAQEQVKAAVIAEKSAQTTLQAANAQVSANQRAVNSLLAKNAVLSDVAAANAKLTIAEERLIIAQEKASNASNKLAQAKLAEAGAINAGNAAAADEFKIATAREASASASLKTANLVVAGYQRKLLALQQLVAAEIKASATGVASAATLEKEREATIRLSAAKDRLLAAQERDSLAKKELVAVSTALSTAGQRELVAAIEVTAQREREVLATQKQLGLARSGVLASEARLKALIAEGGTTAQVAAVNADLALAQSRAGIASDKATASAGRLTTAQLAEAEAAMTASIAANNLEKSQSGLSKVWNFLAGPGGMIAFVILSVVSMIAMFKDQDQATQDLTKSTDEYKDSLGKLNASALGESVRASEAAIKAKKEEINTLGISISLIEQRIEVEGRSASLEAKRKEKIDELAKAQEDLNRLEINRSLTITELTDRYGDLNKNLDKAREEADKAESSYKAQIKVFNDLNSAVKNGTATAEEASRADDLLRQKREESRLANLRLTVAIKEQSDAEEALASLTGLSRVQVQGIIKEGESYIVTMESEGQAIARKIQGMVALTKEQKVHAAELKQLKIEGEALEKTEKARIDTLIRQANSIGILAQQRQANIDKANAEVALSEQQEIILKKELSVLEENLIIQQEVLSFKGANEVKTRKEISDTEALIIKKKGEISARESNTEALKAEALAASLANSLISESYELHLTSLSNARTELENMLLEYQRLLNTGASDSLIELSLQRIAAQTQEVNELAGQTPVIFSIATKLIGQDWDELTTGMDFKTRQTIDIIKTLATEGLLTGTQLKESLSNIISSADTQPEIEAIVRLLDDLRKEGKLTETVFDEFTKLLSTRITAIAKDPSFRIIQDQIEQQGISAEAAARKATELRIEYEKMRTYGAPISELAAKLNELVIAEDAARNAAKGYREERAITAVTVEQYKQKLDEAKASNEGVTDAQLKYNEVLNLYEKQLSTNFTQLERKNQLQDQSRTSDIAAIDAASELAKARGNEAEATRLQVRAAEQEISQAQDRLAARRAELVVLKEQLSIAEQKAITDGLLTLEEKEYIQNLKDGITSKQIDIKTTEASVVAARAQVAAIQQASDVQIAAAEAAREKAAAEQEAAKATKAAAEANAQRKAAGEAVTDIMNKEIAAIRALGGDTEALTERFQELQRQFSNTAILDMADWMGLLAGATRQVKQEFEGQKSTAEALIAKYEGIADGTQAASAAQLRMGEVVGDTGREFGLLNEQDLSRLQSAIEAANQKLREMQHETQDARNELQELNAELLEAQGQDQKAELLRQELDYQERLAAIELRRREAELLGNRDLVALLDRQADVLRQINDAKVKSIQADANAEQAGDKVARSWVNAEAAVRATKSTLGEVHSLSTKIAQTDLSGFEKGMTGVADAATKLSRIL